MADRTGAPSRAPSPRRLVALGVGKSTVADDMAQLSAAGQLEQPGRVFSLTATRAGVTGRIVKAVAR